MQTEACLTGDEITATVLTRWAAGDQDGARTLLVTSTQASLSRFLRRLVGDEETSRELFQETYLRAFRALGSFRGDASLTTWVLTIGRNLAMTRLGRDRARLRSELPLDPGHEPPAFEALSRRPADEVLTRSVFRALDALAVAQREAVLLFYGEDMSLDEIAGVTGRPINTVKSDLLRARARLRNELGVRA